jgi:hypothetical protein
MVVETRVVLAEVHMYEGVVWGLVIDPQEKELPRL